MKSIIKKSLQGLLLVPVIALGAATVAPVVTHAAAADCPTDFSSSNTTAGIKTGADCAQGNGQQTELFGNGGVFTMVVNVLLFIIGAIAVIMLVYGGIRYVLSGGDASAVTAAKNTILYAIVGIVVAIMAYAVVNFVINRLAAA